MEGPLSKWTNVIEGWQYRWFVLDETAGILTYYTSKEKMTKGERRGCVRLKGAVIGIDDEDDSTFTITVDQKMFHFQARDAEERELWIRALESTVQRVSGYFRIRGKKWVANLPSITKSCQEFERRISEADAYLQLMIDHLKELEEKVAKMKTDEKEKFQKIIDIGSAMSDSVKHSIFFLQMTKNQLCPSENGVRNVTTDNESMIEQENKTPSRRGSHQQKVILPDDDLLLTGASTDSRLLVMPMRSYSSSDEEESEEVYFDTVDNEEEQQAHLYMKTGRSAIEAAAACTSAHSAERADDGAVPLDVATCGDGCRQSIIIGGGGHLGAGAPNSSAQDAFSAARPILSTASKSVVDDFANEDIDFDALYEDDEEDELEDVQEHGSIIMHMLSQLSVGMDLTKIVLPTFILERRSLLEMFADFFAHPDLFTQIADEETPENRMVSVVRWYLSSFHAGRKSSVAKKPYNPIIGETFHCLWNVPNLTTVPQPPDPQETIVENGPVPGAKHDQLTFIAEQVSHHPPVSAFYAEHPLKKLTLNGHIWTKSKFLGLSIAVHNVGQAYLNVVDHGEEYVVTFPSGYGRSILTTPWIELGGKGTIQCAKTGYSAVIEFLTKPFWGSKAHQIKGEIFRPQSKTPFVTLKGQWNGQMTAKFGNSEETIFLDVHKVPIVKKTVRPIKEQDEFESRRLWRHVTAALKQKNVHLATKAKHWLEQRQRAEAKERLAQNVAWVPKHFYQSGDDAWAYRQAEHRSGFRRGSSTRRSGTQSIGSKN